MREVLQRCLQSQWKIGLPSALSRTAVTLPEEELPPPPPPQQHKGYSKVLFLGSVFQLNFPLLTGWHTDSKNSPPVLVFFLIVHVFDNYRLLCLWAAGTVVGRSHTNTTTAHPLGFGYPEINENILSSHSTRFWSAEYFNIKTHHVFYKDLNSQARWHTAVLMHGVHIIMHVTKSDTST